MAPGSTHIICTMKQNTRQIQQGDCLFNPITAIPSNCKRRNNRTIALGEATGHHHTFNEGVSVMDAPDGRVYVINETDKPVTLTHQEHKPTVFAPGAAYEFGQVREKDWFSEMVRPVID